MHEKKMNFSSQMNLNILSILVINVLVKGSKDAINALVSQL